VCGAKKWYQFFILRSLSSQNRVISEITVTFKYPDFGMITTSKLKKMRPLVSAELNKPQLLVSSGVKKDIIKVPNLTPLFKILKIRGILIRGVRFGTLMMSFLTAEMTKSCDLFSSTLTSGLSFSF
jgi:hypothetical protein